MNKKYTLLDYLSIPLGTIFRLFSLLPLPILYFFSHLTYFLLYHLTGYRTKVVRQNLRNAFPEKSPQERKTIERKFYRHLADLMAEVIKLRSISPERLRQHVRYTENAISLLSQHFQRGESVMIVMGHMGNWEWAGAAFPLWQKHQVLTAYRPLRNQVMDQFMHKMRTGTGNWVYPMNSLARKMHEHRSIVSATALIADQTPGRRNAYWVPFLNQETPFFKGTEKLAQRFNYPLYYASIIKTGRGQYQCDFQLISANPGSFTKEAELTALHAGFLEKDIRRSPEHWLWSHRRWKHKKLAERSDSNS